METIHEHGLSIGMSRVGDYVFIKMKIIGTLTHEDYEMITPMLENAFESIENPKTSLFIDARNFEGLSLDAVWDELKITLKHNSDFYKIAFLGTNSWQKYGVKISNWFSFSQIEYFEKEEEALAWLSSERNYDEKEVNTYNVTQKEISSREDDIKKQLQSLFDTNMKITNWDVPEADNKEAAHRILEILYEKLSHIEDDIKKGNYDNF
ncbi:MAG: STAS/SEC14 domain-containing protein [Campylobacterota bacterium]|nr:STAS/SEC14 domain-containing protein [Campylobacterota bacterium]